MENRQQQILSEIKALASSIRGQMELFESKVAEFQQIIEAEEVKCDIAEQSDVSGTSDEVEVDIMDIELSPDTEFYSEPLSAEPEPETLSVEEEPAVGPEVINEEPAPAILNDVQPSSDVPVIDAMLDKHAWRTDMPGTAVKDIRSAISLNDRILFINFLFNEDPMSFQETLTKLNSMASFDEAATYMMTAFPHWDWESDTVYRFMMALRRRLQ